MFALSNCVKFRTRIYDARTGAAIEAEVAAIICRVNEDETFDITSFKPNHSPEYVERVTADELSA